MAKKKKRRPQQSPFDAYMSGGTPVSGPDPYATNKTVTQQQKQAAADPQGLGIQLAQFGPAAEAVLAQQPWILWASKNKLPRAGESSDFLQKTLGIPKQQADQLYSQWLQTKYESTRGLAKDPGDLASFAQAGGLGGGGGANDPLNPVVRAQFLARVYQPWAAQQAQNVSGQLSAIGNQFQSALQQYGKNLPAGYSNMFNLNNRQLLGGAQATLGAAQNLANITNNPMAQLMAQKMQEDTAARTKAYMEQHVALSNALSTAAGGGLSGITGGTAGLPSTLSTSLPQANVPSIK